MEYASRAVGNAALTTGIIGTALGALDSVGGLAGLMGRRNPQPPPDPGDRPVTRHDMELYQQINARDFEISTLKSERYTDRATFGLQSQISTQAVWNATQTANIQCLQNQIAQLQSMTKLVIPNSSVNPGWGPVTILPASAAAEVKTASNTDTTNP